MYKKYVIFSVLLSILIVPNSILVYGDHGSGGGGGCSGDCAPPTLGLDNSGREYVENGFTINGKSYGVTHFKQEIPNQVVEVGDSVEVKLKIFEDSGTNYLSHVGLLLGLEEKMVSGVKVHSHAVQILWEQNLDGKSSFEIKDPENFVMDVTVENELVRDSFGNKEGLNQITFKFSPTKSFDTDTILVEMWDYKRNKWTNSFLGPLTIDDTKIENNDLKLIVEPQVPDWFKTNADFWSKDLIDDETFSNGIKYLINEKIMNIPDLKEFQPEPQLHFIDMEKGAQHYIDRYYGDEYYRDWFDSNFPEYTIEEAVGYTTELVIPEWVKTNAELWTNDQISDKEFVSGIQYLIEKGIITLN